MRTLRLFYRAPLAACLSVVLWLGTVASNLILPRRAQRLRRKSQRFFYQTWARLLCRLLGVRVAVDGGVPGLPCLLVTNHLSYVDILVIASVLPARFVAKTEIGSWPLVGSMCRAVDTIFVDRGSRRDTVRVGREMADGLAQGDAIVLFPEGTSFAGHQVGAFKPALLAPAAEALLPVRYGSLRYVTPPGEAPAYLSVSWWGNMPFGPHALELLRLSRIEATLRFGAETLTHDDRKELAQRLHASVSALFEPMLDYEPTAPGGVDSESSAEGDSDETTQPARESRAENREKVRP